MKNSENLFEESLSFLTLNCCFVPDLGLFHGKMGYVLFFACYGYHSKNLLYENFAGELLDEIYEELHFDIPINLEDGLCGIGWGIEFLVQNGYMAGNTDDILEDIDKRIMEYDVRRISNLSFRRGLAGIAFYVIARLSAFREKTIMPFDHGFLDDLKEALSHANFSEADEAPPFLLDIYLSTLNRSEQGVIELPQLLSSPSVELTDDFLSLPFGLENGIAGILLSWTLKGIFKTENIKERGQEKEGLFIFDQSGRASNYGVGTYIQNQIEAVRNNQWNVTIVHLWSHKTNYLLIEQEEDVQHLYVATINNKASELASKNLNKRYYRNVILLLHSYLYRFTKKLFHFNYMGMAELALALKVHYPQSKIVATVHYTNWSFDLLGDRIKLHEMLSHPEKEENKALCKSVEQEKLLFDTCDGVIAIAQHSYNDLLDVYNIREEKLTLIPHGLKDSYSCLSKKKKRELRQKYGFSENEQILIFAGRMDPVKGVEILTEAFIELIKEYPRLRLIVAGDGDYSSVLSKLTPFWSKIIFTGFVEKKILYDLFSISNIGVLPSLHEEFGYVALEMMMMGLPMVVGQTTGLSELIVNSETGITVALEKEEKKSENVGVLKKAIQYLLDSPFVRQQYKASGRMRFLQNYSFDQFVVCVTKFYKVHYGNIEI